MAAAVAKMVSCKTPTMHCSQKEAAVSRVVLDLGQETLFPSLHSFYKWHRSVALKYIKTELKILHKDQAVKAAEGRHWYKSGDSDNCIVPSHEQGDIETDDGKAMGLDSELWLVLARRSRGRGLQRRQLQLSDWGQFCACSACTLEQYQVCF